MIHNKTAYSLFKLEGGIKDRLEFFRKSSKFGNGSVLYTPGPESGQGGDDRNQPSSIQQWQSGNHSSTTSTWSSLDTVCVIHIKESKRRPMIHACRPVHNIKQYSSQFAAYYSASETVDQFLSCRLGLASAGHCGTGSHATLGCALPFQIHGHCGCAARPSALPRRSTLGAHFPRMSTEHG